MLSPRIVILLVWGVLVFPVTASRDVFSPEIVHFFWKLYWFSRNLFKTTCGLFDYSCLEYVFYGITTNYRSIVIIRLIVLVICCSFTIYKLWTVWWVYIITFISKEDFAILFLSLKLASDRLASWTLRFIVLKSSTGLVW